MPLKPMSFALRLAGCWLLWSAWCSLTGWGLSVAGWLSGWGHLTLLPVLLVAVWLWWRSTSRPPPVFSSFKKWRRRMVRPLPLLYLALAVLSLIAGLLNASPWSIDAASYRLPRLLYWLTASHWYWIGTLDHRLDFSSTGFEWQMLPLMELTHNLRLIFLLNWIPFLLFPSLLYIVFRALGVNGRSARRWMWLLPSGYCFSLQCSGLQNDGYAVNYLLAAPAFAAIAFHSRRSAGLWLALLAAALLTGAKVSNLPLLLPLGVFLLPVFFRVPWLNWRLPVVGLPALFCSFVPLAFLSWHNTGDWKGDPADQWHVQTHGFAGPVTANLVLLVRDAAQLPVFPGSRQVNTALDGFNDSAFIHWLRQSHGEYESFKFSTMCYEGTAGIGFGVAMYAAVLLAGVFFVRPKARFTPAQALPWAWRWTPCLAWIAFAVYLVKLGSDHSPRIAAAYYPLLLVPLLKLPRVAAVERKKIAGIFAGCAIATAIFIVVLTPARPLVPWQALARITGSPALEKIAAQYRFWDYLRDEFAPLREQLPANVTRVGLASAFPNPTFGLWRPIGSRSMVELGLPPGPQAPLPPPDLAYAFVTADGLQQRYGMGLSQWLAAAKGQIIFEYQRNVMLDAHSPPKYQSWYLVKLNPLRNATN